MTRRSGAEMRVQMVLRSFSSAEWAVRNSSLLCLCAVMKRAVERTQHATLEDSKELVFFGNIQSICNDDGDGGGDATDERGDSALAPGLSLDSSITGNSDGCSNESSRVASRRCRSSKACSCGF